MKKLVFLLSFVCISMFGSAQTQMAVLQHDGTITETYYGINAFVDAYDAANDGDIITLSAGNFNMVETIGKTITIYGAGSKPENDFPSTLFLYKYVNVNENTTLYVEGVDLGFVSFDNINENCNVQFVKCIIESCRCSNTNLSFRNCLIKQVYIHPDLESNSDVTIINSAIFDGHLHNCKVYNSYISIGGMWSTWRYSLFENCIIACENGYEYDGIASSTNKFSNCVAIKMPNFFNNLTGGIGTNTYRSEMLDVFETFNGSYNNSEGNFNYDEEYNLNNSFATSFLGNDGTEVGLHGGMMPFSLNPSYMIIKRCNVASKTTTDGKLSVDIELDTEE